MFCALAPKFGVSGTITPTVLTVTFDTNAVAGCPLCNVIPAAGYACPVSLKPPLARFFSGNNQTFYILTHAYLLSRPPTHALLSVTDQLLAPDRLQNACC